DEKRKGAGEVTLTLEMPASQLRQKEGSKLFASSRLRVDAERVRVKLAAANAGTTGVASAADLSMIAGALQHGSRPGYVFVLDTGWPESEYSSSLDTAESL